MLVSLSHKLGRAVRRIDREEFLARLVVRLGFASAVLWCAPAAFGYVASTFRKGYDRAVLIFLFAVGAVILQGVTAAMLEIFAQTSLLASPPKFEVAMVVAIAEVGVFLLAYLAGRKALELREPLRPKRRVLRCISQGHLLLGGAFVIGIAIFGWLETSYVTPTGAMLEMAEAIQNATPEQQEEIRRFLTPPETD